MTAWRHLALYGIILVLLSACANEHAVFRNTRVSGSSPRVITEDAKQRNVHLSPEYTYDSAGKKSYVSGWRVCAEASPDVFSAISASASADLGLAKSTGSVEAKARAALAIAEAASTIERTQTVNLLRESMYRTCERYLSGAIGKGAFVVQAGRDWRAMIAILAIEQLTRSARSPATILVAPSTSSVITGTSELAAELGRSARDAETAKIAKETADKAYSDKGCASVPAQVEGEAADVTQKRTECVELLRSRTTAEESLRKADAARTALAEAASKSPSGSTQTQSSTGEATGGDAGGGEQQRSASDLAVVANAVQLITTQALDTDESQLFCIQVLAESSEYATTLIDDCREYVGQKLRYEANWFKQEAVFTPATANSDSNPLGDNLITYLTAPGGNLQAKWASLLTGSGRFPPGIIAQIIARSKDTASIRKQFDALTIDTQRRIVAQIPR